jgi:hypothetical protein
LRITKFFELFFNNLDVIDFYIYDMSNIVNDFNLGTIKITQSYNIDALPSDSDATPYLNQVDEELIVSFIELDRVTKFTNFSYSASGLLQSRYIDTFYRISRNSNTWTDWFTLTQNGFTETEIDNFPPFDPLDQMWIDIKFIRKGTKTDGSIRILSFELDGELLQNDSDGTVIVSAGKEAVIKPPYIYKVFRIDDIEILSPNSITGVEFHYRFSQDNTRTWSDWEPLTKENISTKRINPIRFFQVQYLIKNNSNSSVKIQDINLIGDFQNVSLDYQKTNLYGIRDCCQSYLLGGILDENGNPVPNTTGTLGGQSCTTDNIFRSMTTDEKSKLYNPYQQNQAMNLLNKLSNDAMEVFGWRVKYFVTDPDGKGIDYTLHEFQLYNIVCEDEIKVAVENNQFPDNQIVMNQFDLSLFESFQIHITKESFKKAFGVQRRPSKEDLVYFCDINRMFIVDHAQQFRNFNNAAIYYKVVLKKYNKSSNVLPGSKSVEDRIKELTKNSTIDELFGIENLQDKASIANKPQLQTLTRDPIRLEYKSEIVKELIENSTTIVSKQHYDFTSLLFDGFTVMTQSVAAVTYKNIDPRLTVSDNIGLYLWFNLNNYIEDEVYNFIDNYDEVNSLGWRVNLENDNIRLNLNSDTYTFSFTGAVSNTDLYENIWYCYVLNIDQRNRTLEQWIYKRNVEIDSEDEAKNLPSTILEKVYHDKQVMIPVNFELEGIETVIYASDLKMTNIRLFTEPIPESEHNKILNQYIIADDSKYLVFADNASTRIILPYFPYQ